VFCGALSGTSVAAAELAACIRSQPSAIRSRSSGLSLTDVIFSPDMSSALTAETGIPGFAFPAAVPVSAIGNASAVVNVLDVYACV